MIKRNEGKINFYRTALVFLLLPCLMFSCFKTKLPAKRFFQYELKNTFQLIGDTLKIELRNPLKCPLRIWVQSSNKLVKEHFQKTNPVLLNASSDTVFKLYMPNTQKLKIDFPSRLGDVTTKVISQEVSLPFLAQAQYKVVQGNHGKFSHYSDYSKFALDFNLKTGDTICAISDGFVVGVIEDYKMNGQTKEWRDYANLITIYHPSGHTFSQYVHLNYQGSLVEIGQKVKEHEPIGISGFTGFTTIEHLHLNLLQANSSQHGLISIPMEFKEGYAGEKLKKGDIVIKN